MLRLGLRLALRGSRARILVTALALAFAVAFLLAALGALPARQAKLDRLSARQPQYVASPADLPRHGLLVEEFTSYWFGQPLSGARVGAVGDAPVPPGLRALPAPGELAVSPDLARVLRGGDRGLLAGRLPGRVTQIIGKAGLTGPHELFAYVGVPATRLSGVAPMVTGFGRPLRHEPAPRELRVVAWLGALALLLPVLVLVATATRVSGAARDRRLAAVRLVGASARQARLLVAAESLLVGAVGSALGLAGFVALRGLAAELVPLPDGLFAQDLMPPTPLLLAVLVAVPLLSVGTALVVMRRVVTSPLEVRRRARVRRAGWVRLVPVTVGLALLVLMGLRADGRSGPSPTLLLGGGSLTLVGLAISAPAVARATAMLLCRRGGVATTLAGRRIAADPGAAARVVTGAVLVVFVGSWLLAFLPLLRQHSTSDVDELGRLVPQDTLTTAVEAADRPSTMRELGRLRGVTVVALGQMLLGPPSLARADETTASDDAPVLVSVASCVDLARVLARDLGCNGAPAYRLPGNGMFPPLQAGRPLGVFSDFGDRAGTMTLSPSAPELRWPSMEVPNVLYGGWLLEPSAVPPSAFKGVSTKLVIRHDGGLASAERIRAALDPNSHVATLSEEQGSTDRVYLGYLRAVRIGVVMALLVGALSLLVATVDGVQERRRGLASLIALGTPLRVLRRSVLVQMGAPMLANVGLALGAAAVASWAYLSTDTAILGTRALRLPWAAWSLVGLAALLAVLVATALSLPFLNAAGRPEALHAE